MMDSGSLNLLFGNPVERAVVDTVIKCPPGQAITVNDLLSQVEPQTPQMKSPNRRRLIIDLLKRAEVCGLGKFVLGRRGHPTRFIRSEGTFQTPEGVPTPVVNTPSSWIKVPFVIRMGTVCILHIPADLTPRESEILAQRVSGYMVGNLLGETGENHETR